ncbi:FHA domain-containing protein [Leucobacter sp. CSA2]|uniref:FHA domain-containing protein n=1 Tax=Leucobacter edaphi TaxID=2796472 RepID=A0A934QBN0_9MICO|nr:FtsK/SpoIIIE domain-containing protein [Leucobacter edaphi]MBK0421448.1 FHA domain-containing protein [Leucobacter edaphi]
MRLLIELDGLREVVDLTTFDPSSTLGELLETLRGTPATPWSGLALDGAMVDADTPLQELSLLEGSRIAHSPAAPAQQIRGWNVAVAAGTASGHAIAIPPHRGLIIGRAPQADLVLHTESASWEHCVLRLEGQGVRLTDTGSTNGTFIGGQRVAADGVLITEPTTIVIGGTALVVRPALLEPEAPAPGSLRKLTAAGTAPFNRPPKLGRTPHPDPVVPPTPKEIPEAAKFNLILVLAPILMAVVLVLVLRDLRFAMFALLSPIMAVGMYVESRRRRTKSLREEETRFTAALHELQSTLVRDAASESLRLQESTPDPSIMLRRAALPSTQLWARRAGEEECLSLLVGVGDVPWRPELDMRGVIRLDERVTAVLDQGRMLAAPITADLSDAGVIGIAGDRAGALALARALLVQASAHVGPADLTIGVFCDPGREDEWEWASWLPHTRQAAGDGGRWMAHDRRTSTTLLRTLLDGLSALPTPLLLTVLDSEALTEGRDAPARELLGTGRQVSSAALRPGETVRRVGGIVIAASTDQLPAACTTVVEVGADASCTVLHEDSTERIADAVLSGVSREAAEEAARALARFEDPELALPGAALPTVAKLPELLGAQELTPELVLRLWETQSDFVVPLGIGENGVFSVDLVHDGPHGVVAGTTGSGKSEILKALLASLVAHLTPEQLNLILVDFKGGAAFAAFERLPHTIGTISNLDEQLADRAIRALQAEMRRRQRLFAEAGEGIENLPAYLATNPTEPLPRILFIVDEFKELVKDFPDVLASLVSVAAIGRTLGIHMILATQQPAGVVSEAILTNSNLRIAARVQKADDSSSVISDGSAATISRFHRGRAYIQRGQDDLELVQTAYVSAPVRATNTQRIETRAVGTFGQIAPPDPVPPSAGQDSDLTDLDTLMESVIAANRAAGFTLPRRVWPEALDARADLAGYETDPAEAAPGSLSAPRVGGVVDGLVQAALTDDPDGQRQFASGWRLSEGNILLMGVPGSGTSTTLATLALSLAATESPADLDILALDLGSRSLAPLAGLPHTTAYVGSGPNAKEQQTRFLRHLRAELQRRRESHEPGRTMVILVDGFAALRDELQDYDGQQLLDAFYRVYADGPSVGMHFAVSTTRSKAVPAAMDEVTTQRWVFRLPDDYDYSALGIRGTQKPAPVPGRCVDTVRKLQMQVAVPARGLDAAVREAADRWSDATPKPDAIGVFPEYIPARELADGLELHGDPIRIPVGLREDTLSPAVLELYSGEHALLAGPARSGKSSLLLAIAETLQATEPVHRPLVWGIGGPRSPLAAAGLDRLASAEGEISELASALHAETGPVFLLIDDAERVDDPDQALSGLLSNPPAELTVIAAGRSTELRGMFNHWSKAVRKSRAGVLLQPDVDYDGELLGARIPRKSPVAITPGRGYLSSGGDLALVQVVGPG